MVTNVRKLWDAHRKTVTNDTGKIPGLNDTRMNDSGMEQ
jgi:hypothetical protein